ncbi:MAG: exosortase/archaeosortase family protein [Bacteroidales bacterium]|nr:exosortase/archaeosortase family protein [Bacteroidales bacterium]
MALIPREVIAWYYRLELVVPAYILLFVLLFIRDSFAHHGWRWPVNVGYSIPVPVAFMLWVSTWDGGNPPRGKLHRILVPLVYILIAFAALCAGYPYWQPYRHWATASAVLATLVLETGVVRLVRAVLIEPRTACLATFLGSSLYIYDTLFESGWEVLKSATISMMQLAAAILQIDLTVVPRPPDMVIGMRGFEVLLAPPCSGMDGITLFCCLLSIFILLEWKSVRRISLLLVFLAGILIVFLCNAMRILLLVAIGSIGASSPVGTPAHALLDVMFAMFHDNVGWLLYTIVFCVYAGWIYRGLARESK